MSYCISVDTQNIAQVDAGSRLNKFEEIVEG